MLNRIHFNSSNSVLSTTTFATSFPYNFALSATFPISPPSMSSHPCPSCSLIPLRCNPSTVSPSGVFAFHPSFPSFFGGSGTITYVRCRNEGDGSGIIEDVAECAGSPGRTVAARSEPAGVVTARISGMKAETGREATCSTAGESILRTLSKKNVNFAHLGYSFHVGFLRIKQIFPRLDLSQFRQEIEPATRSQFRSKHETRATH